MISYSAPGKIILFGEHAVVYGYPAIAIAINRRVRTEIKEINKKGIYIRSPNLYGDKCFQIGIKTKPANPFYSLVSIMNKEKKILGDLNSSVKISIRSSLPVGAGLGSSAAVAVSFLKTISEYNGKKLTQKDINNLAYEIEKIHHGTPSGIDNTLATYGGGIRFKKGAIDALDVNLNKAYIVVIDSKIPRKTFEMVNKVRQFYERKTETVEKLFEKISIITKKGEDSLIRGDLEQLGNLMKQNHILLNKLGVGHEKLDQLATELTENDTLGYKLTGAGGGGCLIGLFDREDNAIQAVNRLNNKNFDAFITKLSTVGLKNETRN